MQVGGFAAGGARGRVSTEKAIGGIAAGNATELEESNARSATAQAPASLMSGQSANSVDTLGSTYIGTLTHLCALDVGARR